MDWLKNEKDPVITLCAPPLYDRKKANGLTGDKRGLVTSVTKLNKFLGRLPIAKLFAIANLGGFLSNRSFLIALSH